MESTKRRGIIVQIGETHDERVFYAINGINKSLCSVLWLVQAHKFGLWMAWMPGGYGKYLRWVGKNGVTSGGVHFGKRGIHLCNDYWWIYHTDIYGSTLPEPA
jgi:hypothetical protein